MSTDSDSKLTKHISAVTVVTAEFANSMYGGEYAGDDDDYSSSNSGHVHDGEHIDGHASKINISGPTNECHVRGQLRNVNLGGYDGSTPAVQVINVQSYTQDEIDALTDNPCIPEYSKVGPEKHYYLDLSMSAGGDDTNVQFNKDGAFGGDSGFVYDYDNEKVGIGRGDPEYKLHVDSDNNSAIIGIQENDDTNLGPDLRLRKSRANAIVQDEDRLGQVLGLGYDGDSFEIAAGIQFRVDGTPADDEMPGEIRLITRPAGVASIDYTGHVRLIIKNDGNVGIGTIDPDRKLHVFDDSGSSPVRIEGLTSSAASDVVVVDSNGDLFYNSTLTNQDLFETVSTSSVGGGVSNGASCVASSTTDTLTIDAGTGVEVNANSGTDTVELSLNASINDLNDVDTTGSISNGDVLTYDSGASEWKQLPPTTASTSPRLTTQWVGAESWAPSKTVYNSGNVETFIATDGIRDVGMKALRDNNADNSEFYTTIPIPLSQSLGPPGVMFGAHGGAPGPDDVSGFPTAAAKACRVAVYFVMDTSISGIQPKFNVSLHHNAPATGGDMFPYADGSVVTAAMWNPDHPTAATPPRTNPHIYAFVNSGSYYAISDFSSKSITINPNNCGIFQIKIMVDSIADQSGQGAFATDGLYFIGARLQWTW